jgi:GrpB-like predicted nucleotidyltransferase (UPF0157 family)
MKKTIGLTAGTVSLSPYSTLWESRYRAEARRLTCYASGARYLLEHIGSTAIHGLDAKPIIDIAMQLPSLNQLPRWIKKLEAAGYSYKGEYGLAGRHFFTRGTPVTHHLHLVAKNSEHWTNWIIFRDYLRTHPVEAKKYNQLKNNLARKYSHNRDAYTKAKTPLVKQLLEKALKMSPELKVQGFKLNDV